MQEGERSFWASLPASAGSAYAFTLLNFVSATWSAQACRPDSAQWACLYAHSQVLSACLASTHFVQYLQHSTLEQHLQELQQHPLSQEQAIVDPMQDANQQQQQLASEDSVQQQQQQQPAVSQLQAHVGYGLGGNPEVLSCQANWWFHQGRYDDAYQLTSTILSCDPYATQALVTHLAAAMQMGKKNELFLRSVRAAAAAIAEHI